MGSGSPFKGSVESMKIDLQRAMVRAMNDPMEQREIIRVQRDLRFMARLGRTWMPAGLDAGRCWLMDAA